MRGSQTIWWRKVRRASCTWDMYEVDQVGESHAAAADDDDDDACRLYCFFLSDDIMCVIAAGALPC